MARKKTNSAAEKYERQKALARERQRRRKARKTEEEIEAKKKYDRERQARLRAEKKIKSVADMTPREHRKIKKYWRERNKIRSEKKKAAAAIEDLTPPCCPGSSEVRELSSQKKRGCKQVRKDKAKAYRKIEEQRNKIKQLERALEKYKKRYQREKLKSKSSASTSPKRLVSQTIGREKVSPKIRKQLFLGFCLQKQIQHQIQNSVGSKKKNQQLHKVLGNEKLKQYRVQKYFRHIVPYTANKILNKNSNPSEYTRRNRTSIRKQLSEALIHFYEDDRISRMCPGKKDVIRKGSHKKQRRVLLEPLVKLHKQFQEEHNCKISLSSFTRSRPFWVTFPKLSDRQTCACIKHANMHLLVSALNRTKIIVQKTPKEVVNAVVCSIDNEDCMMSTCDKCSNNEIPFFYEEDFKIKYFKWKTEQIKKVIKGKAKTIKRTVKSKEMKDVSKLKTEFKTELEVFKQHVYYTNYLAVRVKEKTENVKSGELVFRLDFSENYVTKYAKEIQSVHFGASKKQICLNTGVRYAYVDGKVETECFASVSDHLDHQAHAVWAHMIPILERSSKSFPNTTTVHFISDSPSSQYRNRMNMFLFKQIVPKYFPKLDSMTWNFTEAGHGKGPMDGVGGTLKREADRKVLYGQDITCSREFVNALKDCNITLYEVPVEQVENIKREVSNSTIPAIKGIMQLHQVVYSSGVMYGRKLICFDCHPSKKCIHFHFMDVFSDKDIVPPTKQISRKKTKLSVDDVFTSSEEEETHDCSVDDQPQAFRKRENLESGTFVLVELEEEGEKNRSHQFIAICQGNIVNNDIEVMFMKSCEKDSSLYVADESNVSSVHLEQIISILPLPVIKFKGNRVYYKFKKQ